VVEVWPCLVAGRSWHAAVETRSASRSVLSESSHRPLPASPHDSYNTDTGESRSSTHVLVESSRVSNASCI
jgi:hypothetical protein